MSDRIFTILEEESAQDTHSSSPSAPMIGWGIALLCIGIWIGKHMQRQPASTQTPAATVDSPRLTQALQWVSYGKELERAEQYEDAIAIYDQGLAQHPNHFRLWHERGLAFAKLEQFESALDSFDQAYQLRPHDSDLAHERGDTLLQLECYEEAIASFDIYLRYHPGSSHILIDRGYALCHIGRFEEALLCFQDVMRTDRQDLENFSRAHFYQIEALRHLGQLDAALQSSQIAMERYGDASFADQRETIRQQIADLFTDQEANEQTVTPDLESM